MGQAIAASIARSDPDALPIAPTPITPLPLHGLHRLYASAVVAWYRLQDGGL